MTVENDGNRPPWEPSVAIRRIHFFVPLLDALEIPHEFVFQRSTYYPIGLASSLPDTSVAPDSYRFSTSADEATGEDDPALYGTISIIIHSGPPRKLAVEPLIATTQFVNAYAVQQGWAQEEKDLSALDNVEIETSRPWSIAELQLEDYGISEWALEAVRNQELPDWLTQGLMALEELAKAYRIVSAAPISDMNYRSLFSHIVSVETNFEGAQISPPTVWSLESRGGVWVEAPLVARPGLSSEQHLEALQSTAHRLAVNDPFMTYADRISRAEREVEFTGQYTNAILEAAIAIEGLLVSAWLATQWEAGRDAGEAYEAALQLSNKSTKTVLGWLSEAIGGHWDPVNCLEARRWIDDLQRWRNLIVHTGTFFGRPEALESISIARSLSEHLIDRVLTRFTDYPRLCLLIASYSRATAVVSTTRIDTFLASPENDEVFFLSFTSWLADGRL